MGTHRMKWPLLLLSSLTVGSCSRPVAADETAAIKHLLERESATWRAGDVAAHAACWHVTPYSRILVSTADGKFLDVPPAQMLAPSPSMGQGGTSVNTNYHINITGSTAWVSHDEESTARNGQKSYSTEIRLLEKVDGQWKLVGQSIHLHKR
ncbi:hypothetical protein GCM10028822_27760 [Hymenobacter terrigena]